MTRRTLLGALIACVLLLATARPASAQGLASMAAAATASASSAVERLPGCWGCYTGGGFGQCQGGYVPGYFNCSANFANSCMLSSPGCGGSALIPLDPDGSTQYVSRGSRLGVPVVVLAGDPNVRRNCDGVVVARLQSPDDIAGVRARTGILSL